MALTSDIWPSRFFVIITAALAMTGCSQAQPPPPPAMSPLPRNDSGITSCSDNATNGLACDSVPAFPGQDGQFGRDVTANDDSDGHAGFHFTKLGADGQPLAIQNGAWDDGGSEAAGAKWSCVRDEVTGLTWEIKNNNPMSVHYKDHTYTWYNPDSSTNGGSVGTSGGGLCNGTLPVSDGFTGCDTYTLPKYVNDNGGLCGYTDWRVPSLEELRSIVDYGVPYPGLTIDTGYFPNTGGRFWSASPYAYHAGVAWLVSFVGHWSGDGQYYSEYDTSPVRLVRGGQ